MVFFKKIKALALLGLAAVPSGTWAQEFRECPLAPVSNVQEYRIFANGAIYLEVLRIPAPDCCGLVLIVRHPDGNGGEACDSLYWDGELGYAQLSLERATASYDPASGLTVSVPGLFVLPDLSFQNSTLLSLTINQATGGISVSQQLGPE